MPRVLRRRSLTSNERKILRRTVSNEKAGDDPVKAVLERMRLGYELELSAPLFDLPARSAEVLKSFHESASRHFHSGDVRVAHGSRLSETCLRIEMFNRTGLFHLTPDKLSMEFRPVTTEIRASHRWECISSAERALSRAFPELEAKTTVIEPTLSLRIADESVNASGYVARIAGDRVRVDLKEFGDVTCDPCINLEIENEEHGWDADFHAYGRGGENASLLLASCRTSYREGGEVRGLENRVLHLKRLFAALLDGIDLEVETPFWGMPEGG